MNVNTTINVNNSGRKIIRKSPKEQYLKNMQIMNDYEFNLSNDIPTPGTFGRTKGGSKYVALFNSIPEGQ